MKKQISLKNSLKAKETGSYLISLKTLSAAFALLITGFSSAQTGTWTALAHTAPHENMGVCLLLTNGTVMCHDTVGGTYGEGWDLLTPDASGSYVNGTWTTLASNAYDRLFFSSQVLPSGEVYVAGGEYGSGGKHGEVYNPATNTWTTCGAIPNGWNIYDAPSELLYNGNILEGPEIGANGGQPCNSIELWSPTTLNYTTETQEPMNHDEAEWVKLPDSTVLQVGMPYPDYPAEDSSGRYQPKTNTWMMDSKTPNNIYDKYGYEAGCGALLPNGKAIFFGAAQYNDIYTPSGNSTTKGTWAAAANFPTIGGVQVGQPDAPGAMMVNGHELLAVCPIGTSSSDEFRTPTYFLEYDYTTNTFTQVTAAIPGWGADSLAGVGSYVVQMLDLPDGNVFVSISQLGSYSNHYYIYTPGSAAIPQGKPTINSVYESSCGIYKATGKLFNGISEGASYGDDWQMSTNYPLIRLTNGTNVYYATTSNWNRVGAVATDSLEDTTQFVLPASLPSGTYSLVVVVNGFASNPTIFNYTSFAATIAVTSEVTCNGDKNGNATATVTGGSAPYTYKWSNGTSTVSTSNPTGAILSAGTYTLTVSDPAGCSTTATVTITQPATLTVTASATTEVSCNGGSNGVVSATPAGGTSPYTYAWSGGGTSSTKSALSAGTYTITVTDKNGCTATGTATITQPTALKVTASTTANETCGGGDNGSVSATASGGTTPYTYAWSGGGSSSTKSALTAGTYTITVTDKNGCTATAATTVTQPATLTVTASTTANELCNGDNNGSVSATVSNGTSPYTYAWSGGGTSSTKSALTAGTYTITVTDKNGCTATASTTVSQPAKLTVSASATANVSCYGGNNGVVSATVSGGTSPYTYSWSGGGSSSTKSALTAGTYTIAVTDNNGCTATASATISQPTQLTVTANTTANESCGGGDNGSVSSSPSGGTSPYTYSWTGGGTSSSETGLTAGTYTITVTDNNGCTATASTTITQPSTLTVIASVTANVSCNGEDNGSVSSTPSGGNSPYTYLWTGGSTSSTETGLSAGTYTIMVKDINGCSATATATITQPAQLLVSAGATTDVLCNGGSNGVASANPSGGTMPYTYSWTGGSTNPSATGLSAGTYTITITDNNGCSATATATIAQPAKLSITQGSTTATSGCNGSAWVATTGGTSPYTYSWSPGGQTTDSITGQCKGNYCCTITDHNGCVDSVCVNVVTGIQEISNASSINVYPDPNTGNFTVTGLLHGQIVEIYNYIGQKLSGATAGDETMHFNISNYANGIYLIRILSKDGIVVTQTKMVKTN